jgi:hypothetical protein
VTSAEADERLAKLEAKHFEALLRCRWDSEHIANVVPVLVSCLQVADTNVLHRALSGLFRIGPAAHQAADTVMRLMFHSDTLICEVATHTLACICHYCPERAIQPLVQVALNPKLQKAALFALIGLGPGAAPGFEVFISAFESKDARMRRLAVRGLAQSGVSYTVCRPVLSRALKDRNGQVRAAAERLARALAKNK